MEIGVLNMLEALNCKWSGFIGYGVSTLGQLGEEEEVARDARFS